MAGTPMDLAIGRIYTRRQLLQGSARAAASLAAVSTLPALLAACAGESPAASAASVGPATGTVQFWGWPGGIDGPMGVYDAFREEFPDVAVEFVSIGGEEEMQRLKTALLTGTGAPDVGGAFEANTEEFINPDWLTDLSDLIAPIADDIVPGSLSVATANDGRVFGMPADATACGLLYRGDLFEEYGIEPNDVATWDDYIRVGEEIVGQTDGNVRMLFLNREDPALNMQRILHSELATGFFSLDGSKVTIDDEGNIAALELTKRIWDAGIAWPDVTWDAQWAYMDNDQLLSLPHLSWMPDAIRVSAQNQDGKWRLERLPAFEAGGNRNARNSGATYMIPKTAENPDAAWAFLEFAFGRPENQLAMFQQFSLFPSNKKAYELPGFDEPVAFFGGQKVNGLWADIYLNAPPYRHTQHFQQALVAVNNVIPGVLSGTQTAAEALREAADSVRDSTGLG